MTQKCRAFTLLEVVIVIAILSMVASVVGWQINKAVRLFAFQNEVEGLYRDLQEAKMLASVYQTDIHLHLQHEGDSFCYQFHTLEPFSPEKLSQQKKEMKEVKTISFCQKEVKTLDLSLFSQGNLEPRGMLGLFQENAKEGLWIDFQGAFLLSFSATEPIPIKDKSPAFPEQNSTKN